MHHSCLQLGRDEIPNQFPISTPKALQFELQEVLFADCYMGCDKVVPLHSLDSIS